MQVNDITRERLRRLAEATVGDAKERELRNGAVAKGAHGLAVFSCSAAGLFEMLRLSEPIEHEPVISDTPYLGPLSTIGAPERWCVVLVNRRSARLLCGSRDALQEIALVEDEVPGRHDQGGWSQANYQRSVDKDARGHAAPLPARAAGRPHRRRRRRQHTRGGAPPRGSPRRPASARTKR